MRRGGLLGQRAGVFHEHDLASMSPIWLQQHETPVRPDGPLRVRRCTIFGVTAVYCARHEAGAERNGLDDARATTRAGVEPDVRRVCVCVCVCACAHVCVDGRDVSGGARRAAEHDNTATPAVGRWRIHGHHRWRSVETARAAAIAEPLASG